MAEQIYHNKCLDVLLMAKHLDYFTLIRMYGFAVASRMALLVSALVSQWPLPPSIVSVILRNSLETPPLMSMPFLLNRRRHYCEIAIVLHSDTWGMSFPTCICDSRLYKADDSDLCQDLTPALHDSSPCEPRRHPIILASSFPNAAWF